MISKSHAALVIVLLAGAAALLVFRFYTGIALEDALITYRYAENLAEGHGFVFNPGERVFGTTTPLWTLLLAGLALLLGTSAIPSIAWVLGTACAVAAAGFTYAAVRRLSAPQWLTLAAPAAFFLYSGTLWSAPGGMETPLVVLAMAASWWALAARRFAFAFGACAILLLTRVDGVVWSGLLFLVALRLDVRRTLRSLPVAVALLLPWLVFATLYFGSPLPHSIVAKRFVGNPTAIDSLSSLVSQLRWLGNHLAALSPFGVMPGLALFVLGSYRAVRLRCPEFWLLPVFPFTLWLFLVLGHAPRFQWYLVPAAWCSLIVGLFGLWQMVEWIPRRSLRPAALGLLGIILLIGLGFRARETADFHWAYQRNEDGLRRVTGEWLREHVLPGQTVATEAVGYQGYFSRARIIDLAGLISPQVVAIRRTSSGNAESFHRIIRELHPHFMVLRSFEVDDNHHFHGGQLFEHPQQRRDFEELYSETVRFHAPLPAFWETRSHLTVYRRR